MSWNIIFNCLLIIIILHLILKNLDNIQFNLNEGLENQNNNSNNIIQNIEKDIEGSVENLLKTKNNLKYTNINVNTNNIIPKSNKINLLGSDKIDVKPSIYLNGQNNALYGNQCTYGGINQNSNLVSNVNFDENNSQPIDQCYQNNLDNYYKNPNVQQILEPVNDIILDNNLMHQNNSCAYNTTQNIQLNHQNLPTNDEEQSNYINTPCPSNSKSNNNSCNNKPLNTMEKPINGGIIGNYMGFNSCDDNYANYKLL